MGVGFAPYMKQIVQIVKGNWYTLMPPTVYPPVSHLGKVAIEFRILKEGKIDIDGMTVQVSSGDVALDRAARGSLIRADPFPPLPKEFPGQDLRLRFYFYYNLSPYIGISPCVDVRVASGSTLQFAASGKGITNTSVAWTVTGDGCSELACGTISDAGLYTAPLNIPIPPVVFVGATWRTDNKVNTKSRVTIVEANRHTKCGSASATTNRRAIGELDDETRRFPQSRLEPRRCGGRLAHGSSRLPRGRQDLRHAGF